MMETVYDGHTIPHMLNGKAISRATRGHLLISGVLHGMIVSYIYITAQLLMRMMLMSRSNNYRTSLVVQS